MICIAGSFWLKAFALGDRRVEAEELGDGYTDGGEGEGGAKPGQEGTFCGGDAGLTAGVIQNGRIDRREKMK